MADDKNKFDYLSVDDSSCSAITDNIINYVFDINDRAKDIGPAVSKVCDNMKTSDIEDIDKLLNKFYNNLNE